MAKAFDLPDFTVGSWHAAFSELNKRLGSGPVLLTLDEISWIGTKDPDFLGHLKNAWDLHFSRNPQLIFSSEKIGMSVAPHIHKKEKSLQIPRGTSLRHVLIHVNGVTSELVQSQTFDHTIDFSKFLGA